MDSVYISGLYSEIIKISGHGSNSTTQQFCQYFTCVNVDQPSICESSTR